MYGKPFDCLVQSVMNISVLNFKLSGSVEIVSFQYGLTSGPVEGKESITGRFGRNENGPRIFTERPAPAASGIPVRVARRKSIMQSTYLKKQRINCPQRKM